MNQDLLKEIKKSLGECTKEQEKIFKDLIKEYPIDKEVYYDEFTVRDLNQKTDDLILKYYELYVREKSKEEVLEEKLEELIGERYDYYRFNYDKSLTPKEIEKYYLPKDKDIRMMKKLILYQSFRTSFFKMCNDIAKGLQWKIKNFMDMVKKGI